MELAEQWKPRVRAGVWLVAFVAACLVFLAMRDRPLFVSLLAVFAVVEAGRRLHDTVEQQLATGRMTRNRVLWLLVTPLVGAAFIVIWQVAHRDGFGFFGIALFFLGAAVAVAELRRDLRWSTRAGAVVMGSCIVLGTVGVLGLATIGAGWAWWPLLIAIALAPVGLGLLSEIGIHGLGELDWRAHLAVVSAGVVLFGAGLWLVAKDVNDTYTYLFCGVLFVLLVVVAVRSSADALLIVAMTGLVWALGHRTVPVPESLVVADDKPAVVALGDSYISGEGADEFYEGTNRKGDNECRRAPTAYPVSLIEADDPAIPERARLVFLACSGATTEGVRDQLDQFRALRYQADIDVAFVLLSVGGNDALFGSVAQTCLLPGDCSTLGPGWVENLSTVRSELDAVYEEIDDTFGGVPVLVVPYPVPLREEYCSSSGFTRNEHAFLHEFATAVNETVRQAAAEAEFHYVDTMPDSLTGARARLCDDRRSSDGEVEVGVNFLDMNSVVGTLEQASNPLNWFHNSLHPNEHGHGLMREAVVEWLDDHPGLSNRSPAEEATAEAEVVPAAAAVQADDSDGECQGSEDLDACTSRWSRQELGRALLVEGWIAGLLAAGMALIVLVVVRQARLLFDDDDARSTRPG